MPRDVSDVQSRTLAAVKQAREHVSCGDAEQAERLLRAALKMIDDSASRAATRRESAADEATDSPPAAAAADIGSAAAQLPQLRSLVHNGLAVAYKSQGKLPKAARALHDAQEAEEAGGGGTAKTALNLCAVYTSMRKFDKAVEAADAARTALDRVGNDDPLAWAVLHHNRAQARLHQFVALAAGDPRSVLEELQLATSYARESDTDAGRTLLASLEDAQQRLMAQLAPRASTEAPKPAPPRLKKDPRRPRQLRPVGDASHAKGKAPSMYRAKAPRPPARTARKPAPPRQHPDVNLGSASARQRAATPVAEPEAAALGPPPADQGEPEGQAQEEEAAPATPASSKNEDAAPPAERSVAADADEDAEVATIDGGTAPADATEAGNDGSAARSRPPSTPPDTAARSPSPPQDAGASPDYSPDYNTDVSPSQAPRTPTTPLSAKSPMSPGSPANLPPSPAPPSELAASPDDNASVRSESAAAEPSPAGASSARRSLPSTPDPQDADASPRSPSPKPLSDDGDGYSDEDFDV